MTLHEPLQLPPSKFEKQKKIGRIILELAETLLLAVFLFLVINTATSRIYVKSISMQPTLYEQDMVLINRLAYQFGKINRKDIIVFMPPLDGVNEPYIKRVIGLPGDDIRILNGRVIINGQLFEENYLKAPPSYAGTWKVPENHLFLLGDNRNSSSDSHYWGMVPVENVIGRAEFIYWPANHLKILNPASAAAAGVPEP
jgi:signal peptidase I